MHQAKKKVWGLALWLAALCLLASHGPRVTAQTTATTLDGLAHNYGITILSQNVPFPVQTYYGPITGKSATQAEVNFYTPLLISEFSKYPPDYVKKSSLQRIALCQNLAYNGQLRNAVPDFEHNTLYIDVARGTYSTQYLRKVIHHEFYHIVDYRDDGQLYQDPVWEKLNPPGFHYGSGGKNMQNDSTVSLINDSQPGFLNKYSTSAVEEDKAEIFSNLMVNYQAVDARAHRDAVIAAKVAQMKKLVATFSPPMNAQFWDWVRTHPTAN